MKSLFYDLETTGVQPHINGIHQIGGIVVIDNVVKEAFNIKVRPHPKSVIESSALAVCGKTKEEIMAYQSMEEGFKHFREIVNKYVDRYDKRDKFHLIGFNNRAFDDQFLRRFFEYNGDDYFGSLFWSDSMDMSAQMSYVLKAKRHLMQNFKLGTVCNYVGIPFDKNEAHDAMYDVRKTRELYNLLEMY